jgi:hypothetical protein
MREGITLSCPFCHAKSEYRDAPQGSTVRCVECESIFRVPAGHRHAPGSVVAGEAIRGSKKKLVVILLVLLAVAAGGAFAWHTLANRSAAFKDPYEWLGPRFPEDSPHGTLARFLQSWKDGNQTLMLYYCRAQDSVKSPDRDEAKKFDERLQVTFGNYKLISYDMSLVKQAGDSVFEYPSVELTGEDKTRATVKGTMSPKVYLEEVPGAKPRWGVDLWSAAPSWD